ncbi:MAG: ABC transporter permease [Planctomycetes bacterium]|nr:ABC transporter permease [Planctomycetota bacterium]
MKFVARVNPRDADIVVLLEGGLEHAAPGALGQLVDMVPGPDGRTVIIDLEGVARLGALGVAMLTTLVGGLQDAGHEVRLRVKSDVHKRVIRAFGRDVPQPELPGPEAHILIERLGERTIQMHDAIVRFVLLTQATLASAITQPFRLRHRRSGLTQRSVVAMGVGATPLVALIAFLIGFILALQSGDLLKTYGQTILIADLVGLAVTKEIAPLLTAILVAGRSGSSLTAEIGTMKVSEEVDALTVMGVDPIDYLVAPRLRALLLVLPMLTIVADVVAVAGGITVGWMVYDIQPEAYIEQTTLAVELGDVLGGLLKACCFSIVIVTVAAYQGFATAGGATGVGKHTTRSVVQAIIWIIIVDGIFTALLTALP